MESQPKRTTQEQLQHYILFCKKHPEFQRRKLTSANRQQVQMLWSELAHKLNSLRGPTRTAAKWKESLTHWKHQLRSRARKFKAHKQVTCGGSPGEEMTVFEEREIAHFATTAVDELPCAGTLGQVTCGGSPKVGMTEFEEQEIVSFATTAVDGLPGAGTLEQVICGDSPKVEMTEFEEQEISSFATTVVDGLPGAGTLRKQVLPLEEVLKKIEAHERREEQAIALQQKIVEQNQQMTEVLSQMSQSLTSITAVLTKLCDKLNKW